MNMNMVFVRLSFHQKLLWCLWCRGWWWFCCLEAY